MDVRLNSSIMLMNFIVKGVVTHVVTSDNAKYFIILIEILFV